MRYLCKTDNKIKYLAVEPGPVKTDIYRTGKKLDWSFSYCCLDSGFEEPPWEGFDERPSPDEGAYPILYCCVESVNTGDFRKVPDGR